MSEVISGDPPTDFSAAVLKLQNVILRRRQKNVTGRIRTLGGLREYAHSSRSAARSPIVEDKPILEDRRRLQGYLHPHRRIYLCHPGQLLKIPRCALFADPDHHDPILGFCSLRHRPCFAKAGWPSCRRLDELCSASALRGVLLVTEIAVFVYGLAHTGLATTQAIFQAAPLIVTVLSIPFLGEHVGWRRWMAVSVGLLGVLMIINPSGDEFNLYLLLPLMSAFMFAIYSVATRAVSRKDGAFTSLFYTAVGGALVITLIGPFFWTPIAVHDWPFVGALCICGAVSHYCLIRAYEFLQASEVQPLTYLQLVVGAIIAVTVFGETISWNMLLGSLTVVGAGLFTMWREPRAFSKNSPATRSGVQP